MNAFLPAVALLPLLAIAGGVILLRMQRQEKAFTQRVATLHGKGPRPTPTTSASLVKRDTTTPTLTARLASLIAYDSNFRAQYRMPWPVVLGVAALLSRAAVLGASGVVGSVAWVLLPIVTVGGTRAYYAGANRKRRDTLLSQFPDALALIVRAVQVGIPVPESLRAVARESSEPTRSEFDRLQGQIAMGIPLDVALRELALRNSLPEYGFFAAVITLQAQTGGALSDTLETLADIIRRRIAMKERGHALSSEARTSSYVLGALPLFAGGMMYFASPAYIGLLFTNPIGHMLLGAAALSLATGMGAMRFIIRKSLS